MRYTISKENEVRELVAQGKSVDYISALTNVSKKTILNWCPELKPNDETLRLIIKQRFRLEYSDWEAKITNSFSPFLKNNVSDDEWIDLNKTVYDVLYEESMLVAKSVLKNPPDIKYSENLSDELFLSFLKNFWNINSEYVKQKKLSENYVLMNYNSIHYWSLLRTRKLKNITKSDIEVVHEKLKEKDLSQSRVNSILRTGLIPLKFAYIKGFTVQKVFDYELPKTPLVFSRFDKITIFKIFNQKWNSFEAKLANLIGYFTGFELQEVLALTLQDLYLDGYITSSHIYNKNGYCLNPYPKKISVSNDFINLILKYASTSPYKDFENTDFIFYSVDRDKPTRQYRYWSKSLQNACSDILLDTKNIDFSVWHRNYTN